MFSSRQSMSASLPVSRGDVRAFDVWATFWSNRRAAQARRATITELARLDDVALADIGIHRSQIAALANNPGDRFPR
jgi:uncharacterized protein YjiS (DUF1127 family)